MIGLELHPDVINNPNFSTYRHIRPWPGPFPVGGRRSVFRSYGRYLKLWQPLLTCKQIYDEAIAIYWSETIVCNQRQKGYFSRSLFFERIPDFAKLHVQHLRNVPTCVNPGVKALQGIAFTRQASFAEALDAFPKLQTCSVQDVRLGPKPSKAVKKALVRHPKVHFLKTYPGTIQGQTLSGNSCYSNLEIFKERTYIDFTTGMKLTIDTSCWSQLIRHEDSFRNLMELQPSEKAGANGEA